MRFDAVEVGARVIVRAGRYRGRRGVVSYVPARYETGTGSVGQREVTVEFPDGSWTGVKPRWLDAVDR